MKISELYEIYKQHPFVTTDTRNCPEGGIFFALKGERFNGNLFAEDALKNGCAYAVVDEWDENKESKQILVVEDALAALQQLAAYHREQLKIPVLGIAGSNGKTTTKELIASILQKRFKVAYTQGNLNNHIGVPLTVLSISPEDEIAVVEMGANHVGEIAELCEIAKPDVGMITNIGKAHIEGFGSYENVIQAKCELYDYIREHEGKVFVNRDNPVLTAHSGAMDRILYGRDDSSLFVSGTLSDKTPFLHFDWNFFEHPHQVKTNLVGEYNLDNALAAAAIGKYYGITAKEISDALENYTPKNNRSQFERTAYNDLIIDAYNANPSSMKLALEHFVKIPTELPKAVMLGDMNELGIISDEEHRELLEFVKQQQFDKAYLIGPIFNDLASDEADEALQVFPSVDALCEQLQTEPLRKHYVLLKGSRGIELERTLKLL